MFKYYNIKLLKIRIKFKRWGRGFRVLTSPMAACISEGPKQVDIARSLEARKGGGGLPHHWGQNAPIGIGNGREASFPALC